MRKPVIVISPKTSPSDERTLTVFHDIYTHIFNTNLLYICKPNQITLDNNSACELPYECFDDLV